MLTMRLVLGDRDDSGVRHPDVVVGGEQDLETPQSRRDRDHIEQLGGLVNIDRVVLLASQCRHATPDVASQRLDLLQRHRVDLLVPGRSSPVP